MVVVRADHRAGCTAAFTVSTTTARIGPWQAGGRRNWQRAGQAAAVAATVNWAARWGHISLLKRQ